MESTNIKVTKVTASFGGKVNTGNYSNVDVSITVEAEVREGANVAAAIEDAQQIARQAVLNEVSDLSSPQKQYWLEAVEGKSDPDDLPY